MYRYVRDASLSVFRPLPTFRASQHFFVDRHTAKGCGTSPTVPDSAIYSTYLTHPKHISVLFTFVFVRFGVLTFRDRHRRCTPFSSDATSTLNHTPCSYQVLAVPPTHLTLIPYYRHTAWRARNRCPSMLVAVGAGEHLLLPTFCTRQGSHTHRLPSLLHTCGAAEAREWLSNAQGLCTAC